MKIIKDYPPNFAAIVKVFPMAVNPNVLFAYHDAIYYRGTEIIPPSLIAHEQVHIDRQGGTVESTEIWWTKYMEDMDFRFNEELLAHRAEWKALCAEASRQVRRHALETVAKKLASPLYGRMMSANKCAIAIKGDE